MAKLFQINNESLEYFQPLLTERCKREFLSDPNILAVGAVEQKEACGIMLIHVTIDSLYLTYIYVDEYYRRNGIGTELLTLAKRMAFKNDKLLMIPFCAQDQEEGIYRFFRTDPALALEETGEYVYRVPVDSLQAVKDQLPKKKGRYETVPFETLTTDEKNGFFKKCEEECVRYYDLYSPDYISPLCLAAKKDDKISAVILTKRGSSEDEILLDYVYGHDFQVLADLLRDALEAAADLPKKVRYLKAVSVNEESKRLVDSLLPTAEKTGTFYMASLDI